MRVVALLTVRNEALYLGRCLEHLRDQGVDVCLIDNGSTDRTPCIARDFYGKGVFRLERLEHGGFFELYRILENEERLAREIPADWFIHHDADEILEAPRPYRTLAEGLAAADREGFNAVDFREFVFVPTDPGETFENTDYVRGMRRYYFYQPRLRHRVKAWKNAGFAVNLREAGGHEISFEGRRIYPQDFIMRHYMALSRAHALKKYGERVYAPHEVGELGWHRARVAFQKSGNVSLPAPGRLKEVASSGWDTSDPWTRHAIFEGTS